MNWTLIWLGLALGSAIYLGYIAFELIGKAKRAAKALEPGLANVTALAEALAKKVELEAPMDNLLDDPGPHIQELKRRQKRREALRSQRQRRLINKLIEYQADESEFKP